MAFALGWIVHVGTDTIAHSFVNEQCGGPYRDHPTRHHLIENHIDAWNYAQTGEGGTIPGDPWGKTEDYPELSSSALWFEVQLTPDDPAGKQRPSPLSDDPDIRKKQLDVDGELPGWLTEGIVKALIETFADSPHPKIYQGDAFQQAIDEGKLTTAVKGVTGHGLDRPFQELLDAIAPPPPFAVPKGFPLPWEVGTAYRLMITMYKLNFNGGWELPKPRLPDFLIVPPLDDFTNLFQPPDFSGVDGDNLVEDVCDVLIGARRVGRQGDRRGRQAHRRPHQARPQPVHLPGAGWLYKIAMKIWDVATKSHDVMAHTGLLDAARGGALSRQRRAQVAERDRPAAHHPRRNRRRRVQAGARATPSTPSGTSTRTRASSSRTPCVTGTIPYYPVLQFHATAPETRRLGVPPALGVPAVQRVGVRRREHRGPVADGDVRPQQERQRPERRRGPRCGAYKPMRPGPYPEGTTPDQVFFRTDAPIDPRAGPHTKPRERRGRPTC